MGLDPDVHSDVPPLSLTGNTLAEERSAAAYVARRIQDADARDMVLAALGLATASAGLIAFGHHLQTGGNRA